jgi:hypothetical protein
MRCGGLRPLLGGKNWEEEKKNKIKFTDTKKIKKIKKELGERSGVNCNWARTVTALPERTPPQSTTRRAHAERAHFFLLLFLLTFSGSGPNEKQVGERERERREREKGGSWKETVD